MDITNISASGTSALQSEFFLGGLALGLLGAGVALLHRVRGAVHSLLLRHFMVTVVLDNRGPAFRALTLWLAESRLLSHVRRLRVAEFSTEKDDGDPTSVFTPSQGRHWFFYEGRLCVLDHQMNEKARVDTYDAFSGPLETMTLTLIGRNKETARRTVTSWLTAGAEIDAKRSRIGPELFALAGNHWNNMGCVPRRALATLACEGDVVERLQRDIERFLMARSWYAERGVPWRRGYLLYGPPGTGKSSLVRALASELSLSIATVDLGRQGMSDEGLRRGMADAPKRALLVIEDVDAIFVKREGGQKKQSQVSFSGLLNAIDGVGAQEGRALIMTTNHREKLDPALIRPGRADLHVELGHAGGAVAGAMFRRFFPGEDSLAQRFAAGFGEERRAPAEIQGWLLAHADLPEIAANAIAFLRGEEGPDARVLAAE